MLADLPHPPPPQPKASFSLVGPERRSAHTLGVCAARLVLVFCFVDEVQNGEMRTHFTNTISRNNKLCI